MTLKTRGATANVAGLAAEIIAERDYLARGYVVVARRYKKPSGEIDLIMCKGDETVFVEVKKSKTHDLAAQAISSRQISRIHACASEFLSSEPAGQETPSRFDAALVDALGRVKCLENISMA